MCYYHTINNEYHSCLQLQYMNVKLLCIVLFFIWVKHIHVLSQILSIFIWTCENKYFALVLCCTRMSMSDTNMHVGTLLCTSCIYISSHSSSMVVVCNHHIPVSDSDWNPSCPCFDILQIQERERFDNCVIFKHLLWLLLIHEFSITYSRASCICTSSCHVYHHIMNSFQNLLTGCSAVAVKKESSYQALILWVCHFCPVFQRWYHDTIHCRVS